MMERILFSRIRAIPNPKLRLIIEHATQLLTDNWFYLLFVVFLWRFPYLVADWTGSEVMPRRPTGESAFWQSEMARALVVACLAMSYNLLFGYCGIVSFGHALYFGAGGYITFIMLLEYDSAVRPVALAAVIAIALALTLSRRLNIRRAAILAVFGIILILLLFPSSSSLSIYQAAGTAVIASIAVSLVSGAVTLRLRGIYFTMFTLALAEMFFVLAKSGTFRNITGAEDGLGFRDILPEAFNATPTTDGSRLDMYRFTVIFFVIVFLAIRRYLNSPVGRVIVAIRENEVRARTIGYNTLYYKVMTMTFAGVIATLSGLLFVLWATDKRVHPETLSMKWTVEPLLHTLIGGVGTLTGPVIAALGLGLGETYLRNETFTLDTTIGPAAIWQIVVLLFVVFLVWIIRRTLREGVRFAKTRLNMGETAGRLLIYGSAILSGLIIGLVVGDQIVHSSSAHATQYEVSNLWDLLLGIVFILVVMVLPHGIVGTWNRYRIARRIRQMERAIHYDNPTR